jgi:hypothetical protein
LNELLPRVTTDQIGLKCGERELSPTDCSEARKFNRWIQFMLFSIRRRTTTNLLSLNGAERPCKSESVAALIKDLEGSGMPTQGLKPSPMAEEMEFDWSTISRAVSPRGYDLFTRMAPHIIHFEGHSDGAVGSPSGTPCSPSGSEPREDAQRFSDGARVKLDFDVFLQKFWPHITQQRLLVIETQSGRRHSKGLNAYQLFQSEER